jgi:integrase/recombinase XerD
LLFHPKYFLEATNLGRKSSSIVMNTSEQQRFDSLYEQHLTNLTLQGKRPATIDAYSRAVRRIAAYFDCCPDKLNTDDLKRYFAQLIASHSWSTVKLDPNGLQFFYRYVLNQSWEWLNIVKPPQVKRRPDILTPCEVAIVISLTRQLRYQVFFLTLYSMVCASVRPFHCKWAISIHS